MFWVTAGSDTYGRVKTVAGTPIITQFAMLQLLPLYPIESFYFLSQGPTTHEGIPLLASKRSTSMEAIPLARIDKTSVVMAYIRALLALMVFAGCFGIFVEIAQMIYPAPMDKFGRIAVQILCSTFAVGLIGGVLSYFVPLTSGRERAIRERCAEMLGMGVDPARIEPANAARFARAVIGVKKDKRTDLLKQLIAARAKIAHRMETPQMEAQTDALLAQLDRLNRSLH